MKIRVKITTHIKKQNNSRFAFVEDSSDTFLE
jgi:hypothetical protein